jgi:transposase
MNKTANNHQDMLRAAQAALAAAKHKIDLQARQINELVEENAKLKSGRWATEEFLQNQIRMLELEKSELEQKLEDANKQLVWLRTQKFGKTNEQNASTGAQATSDKDAGAEGQQAGCASGKRSRGQQPNSKGPGRSDKSEVDTDVKFIELPGCACSKCNKPYRLLPRSEASPLTEIEISIIRTVFQRCMYVSQCDCEGKRILVAPPPPKLIQRTEIGNSIWVHLLFQRFLQAVPQNRTLKELSLLGLHLPAGTVTDGCKVINDLLDPLMVALIHHCQGADFWNADETFWRVFGQGKQRWWFWLIASHDAVVYLLDPSRSKKVPMNFFAGSAGVLMTDRLASYKALQQSIRKAWCLVHLRRDVLNVYKGIPQLKPWAKGWLQEIATLFVLSEKRFKLWQQDRTSGEEWDRAVLELELHAQKLKDRFQKELQRPKLHKEQAKILRSMKRHWAGYMLFLEDPRIPLHNNRAERLLRNSVCFRKNSYGSGAIWSGHLAAKVFSIFQTWLINGLDPHALLRDYFDECSKTPGKPPPDVSQFLPWTMSEERKRKYALPESYKRPG